MTLEMLAILLDEAKWKFAKTMPQWPHDYTLKETWANPKGFQAVAEHIHVHGKQELWHYEWKGEKRSKPRRYFYLGKYKYWIMEKTPQKAILINRALVE